MIERLSKLGFAAFAFVALLNLGILGLNGQSTNGIFADFTTSKGKFTCWLDYTNAPRTVANFIGLATGQRAWMDWNAGQVRTNPFYNGQTFHRVITNFMIQGGSPNGLGNDGPGYVILDEFSPSLRHNRWGTLSMANSGVNSGGAQFFITVTNSTPWLDNQHAVFGWLLTNGGGSNVVYSISRVATDPNNNNKPWTNVVITNIVIRRVGTAASNFNILTQPLPTMQKVATKITKNGQEAVISFTNVLYAHNRLFESDNLTNRYWTNNDLTFDVTTPVLSSVTRTPDGSRRFFTLTRAQYPSSTWTPRSITGRTLTLNYTNSDASIRETNRVIFTTSTNGTYVSSSSGSGSVTGYDWYQDVYKGYVWPLEGSGFYPMTLELDFTSDTGGMISGTVYFSYPVIAWYNIAGTFTLSGP